MAEWHDTLTEAQRLVDDVRYHARSPEGVVSEADWSRLGSASDYIGQVLAMPLQPVDEPPHDRGPTTLHGVAISYPGHAPARDLYLGYTEEQAQWGPHDSLAITAPVAGTVSLYTFSVGGALRHQPPEAQALFTGWVCIAPPSPTPRGLQPMHVAVLVYDTPIPTPWGAVRADWAAHVRGDVRTGRVAAGEPYAVCWDSGIRFENSGVAAARAAHIHACASATGTLTPNGDLDGRAFAYVRGWEPLAYLGEGGPGPGQYQQGRYTAGRLTSDFQRAGKPIPPMPGRTARGEQDVFPQAAWPGADAAG